MAIEMRDCPHHGVQKVIRTEFRADPDRIAGSSAWQQLKCGDTLQYDATEIKGREYATPTTNDVIERGDATTAHERIVDANQRERGMLTSAMVVGTGHPITGADTLEAQIAERDQRIAELESQLSDAQSGSSKRGKKASNDDVPAPPSPDNPVPIDEAKEAAPAWEAQQDAE